MRKSRLQKENVSAICKYNLEQVCSIPYNRSCSCGGYCSHDPNRFKDKLITKGQVNFLLSKGYAEEDIINMSLTEAGDEINKIKREAPLGTFKVWGEI